MSNLCDKFITAVATFQDYTECNNIITHPREMEFNAVGIKYFSFKLT